MHIGVPRRLDLMRDADLYCDAASTTPITFCRTDLGIALLLEMVSTYRMISLMVGGTVDEQTGRQKSNGKKKRREIGKENIKEVTK